MTKQQGIGTYLAQGWAANAILTYLWMLGFVLINPSRNDGVVLTIALPIYFFIMGAIGGAVGILVWIIEFTRQRKINTFYRGAGAILVPVLLTTTVAALAGSVQQVVVLLWITITLIVLVLPPALLSGSRLNPLEFVVMDLRRELPTYGWSRALSMIAIPLLRLTSALGLLEALLYLACQRSLELGTWDVAAKEFTGGIVTVLYFATTLAVSLCLPEKIIVAALGTLANAPVVAFAFFAQRHSSFEYHFLAVVAWLFVLLWALFLVSQPMRSETRRMIPVTMLEIRIRHALNYW